MLGKLAYRNAKRSLKDYLTYLVTITISFSLILAFNLAANSDEAAKLSSGMSSFKTILIFVNVVVIFVVCFLVNYKTKFMFEKKAKNLEHICFLESRKKNLHVIIAKTGISDCYKCLEDTQNRKY